MGHREAGDRLHLGVELIPQHTSWRVLRDLAAELEELGYDSLWTTDHLLPRSGDPSGPVFEAWQLLPAWAAATSRIRLGTLVSSATFRHPALLAKMVVTLDHISSGRAILGIGAGNFQSEHGRLGIPFGDHRQRLERLTESLTIVRGLTRGERVTYSGRHYQLTDAVAQPVPVQSRIPMLIGGQSDRAIRVAAEFGDIWHTVGAPEVVEQRLGALRRRCAVIGRDPDSIRVFVTLAPTPIVRESAAEVSEWVKRTAETYGLPVLPEPVAGTEFAAVGAAGNRATTVDAVRARIDEYRRIGVHGFVLVQLAPFDRMTLRAIASAVG
jgi:probable F420-dependent oxidoreductase